MKVPEIRICFILSAQNLTWFTFFDKKINLHVYNSSWLWVLFGPTKDDVFGRRLIDEQVSFLSSSNSVSIFRKNPSSSSLFSLNHWKNKQKRYLSTLIFKLFYPLLYLNNISTQIDWNTLTQIWVVIPTAFLYMILGECFSFLTGDDIFCSKIQKHPFFFLFLGALLGLFVWYVDLIIILSYRVVRYLVIPMICKPFFKREETGSFLLSIHVN